jgi:hypothetical protein
MEKGGWIVHKAVGGTPTEAGEKAEQQKAGPQQCGLPALPELRDTTGGFDCFLLS